MCLYPLENGIDAMQYLYRNARTNKELVYETLA